MGCVTMTYNAPLKKYLMCVTDGGNDRRLLQHLHPRIGSHHRPLEAGRTT